MHDVVLGVVQLDVEHCQAADETKHDDVGPGLPVDHLARLDLGVLLVVRLDCESRRAEPLADDVAKKGAGVHVDVVLRAVNEAEAEDRAPQDRHHVHEDEYAVNPHRLAPQFPGFAFHPDTSDRRERVLNRGPVNEHVATGGNLAHRSLVEGDTHVVVTEARAEWVVGEGVGIDKRGQDQHRDDRDAEELSGNGIVHGGIVELAAGVAPEAVRLEAPRH
mmetsp:Transcript_18149/g.47880  ORF Transcript_18149/g.47880 Transcript_18149/m.47880 type:complete len:219 (+) Transcript_18149:1594-2250(+)